MTGRSTLAALLACASALSLATPAASAKPGYFVFPGYRSMEVNLAGNNGYRISIDKSPRGYVSLSVSKEPNVIVYSARSLAPEKDRIKARFPGLGRVSVQFRPQGPPRKSSPFPFPECRGGEILRQHGHFVGTIRFRGERGYTSVRASRVKGVIETATKEVCKRSPSDNDPEPAERTELWTHSRSGGRAVGFSAYMLGDPIDLTSFDAMVAERRRGVGIFRWTVVTGARGDLLTGDTRPYPLTATITPPAPFSGSAQYERTPGGDRTWTGSLAVTLPGLGRVRLAGPRFSPRLCQGSGCSGNSIDGHSLPWMTSLHERLRLP
jgi:hypothetical protein